MKRLVIAPHMDDESLGCGGLLAKYPGECVVAVVADGDDVRRREHAEALAVLGLSESISFDFPDGRVAEDMPALVRTIDDVMTELKPDEVYLPFPSLHQDHIATYEAGMRSARVSMSTDHWVPTSLFIYDIAVYDLNLYPSDLRWNVFEELTEEHADRKTAACHAYESERPTGLHPMNSIKELAASVGHVRLLGFAEQYALVRQVRR